MVVLNKLKLPAAAAGGEAEGGLEAGGAVGGAADTGFGTEAAATGEVAVGGAETGFGGGETGGEAPPDAGGEPLAENLNGKNWKYIKRYSI